MLQLSTRTLFCSHTQRALVATRASGHVLLPPLLSSTTSMFAACHHSGCCDVMGTTAEMFGEVREAHLTSCSTLKCVGHGVFGTTAEMSGEVTVCVGHILQNMKI